MVAPPLSGQPYAKPTRAKLASELAQPDWRHTFSHKWNMQTGKVRWDIWGSPGGHLYLHRPQRGMNAEGRSDMQ
jgi:hypothetical protein